MEVHERLNEGARAHISLWATTLVQMLPNVSYFLPSTQACIFAVINPSLKYLDTFLFHRIRRLPYAISHTFFKIDQKIKFLFMNTYATPSKVHSFINYL